MPAEVLAHSVLIDCSNAGVPPCMVDGPVSVLQAIYMAIVVYAPSLALSQGK